jgi:thiosulfate reductase cytochrome b subunit
VLLPRDKGDGQTRLAPHNLITAWYWTYGDPARPVPLRYLEAAWLLNGAYVPEVLALFDADTDGALSDEELRLDTPEKQALIQSRLAAQGLDNLALVGELQPYSINHNVVGGDWALRDCQACHADESRVSQGITLADYTPHGASLNFAPGQAQNFSGQLEQENQAWVYTPDLQSEQVALYVLGHNNLPLVDYLGLASILGVSLAIFGHSSLRYLSARQPPPHHGALRREYMYTVYERQWHWLQTALILGLIFSGLVIHKPEYFGMFSFRYMVSVHNVLAAILVVNAALAAFYHLVSGEIQQFIPQPRDFFHQAILQARYYLWGIFRGEPHPFEKSAKRKMNPLQQITYLAILNVLLPLQVITGAIMWGAQRYPDQVARIGGLTYLGPIHSLVAWLFVSFIIAHVYLTTTGHTPLAGIRAMVVGWDELEGPAPTADTTHTENIKE